MLTQTAKISDSIIVTHLVMVYFGFLRMSAFHVLGDADASHWHSKVRAGNNNPSAHLQAHFHWYEVQEHQIIPLKKKTTTKQNKNRIKQRKLISNEKNTTKMTSVMTKTKFLLHYLYVSISINNLHVRALNSCIISPNYYVLLIFLCTVKSGLPLNS